MEIPGPVQYLRDVNPKTCRLVLILGLSCLICGCDVFAWMVVILIVELRVGIVCDLRYAAA